MASNICIAMPSISNSERVAAILDITQQIASGNFSARIHISDTMDELDALGTSINMLAEELGTRDAQIQKQMSEMQKFNKMFVDRELKMTELKEEISELRKEIQSLKTSITK